MIFRVLSVISDIEYVYLQIVYCFSFVRLNGDKSVVYVVLCYYRGDNQYW